MSDTDSDDDIGFHHECPLKKYLKRKTICKPIVANIYSFKKHLKRKTICKPIVANIYLNETKKIYSVLFENEPTISIR